MGRIVDIIVSRDGRVHAVIIDFGGSRHWHAQNRRRLARAEFRPGRKTRVDHPEPHPPRSSVVLSFRPEAREGPAVNRRDFITPLGGAVAWPLAARAQQRKPMRRVGALMPYAANDPHMQIRDAAFLQGMQRLGWTVGDNIQIARHRSRDRCAHQYRSPHLRAADGREVPADGTEAANRHRAPMLPDGVLAGGQYRRRGLLVREQAGRHRSVPSAVRTARVGTAE